MNREILGTVVLIEDLPDYGLKAGDIGTIVELYQPDGIEVEFVTASGRTRALVTLKTGDVRTMTESDVLAVRSLDAARRRLFVEAVAAGKLLVTRLTDRQPQSIPGIGHMISRQPSGRDVTV